MTKRSLRTFLAVTALAAGSLSVACGSPAVPFDTLKNSNVVVYKLQNFEPPAPVATAAPQPGVPMIPGIPPEIQAWAQQAAPQLQQMIPPGLLPPGLIPGFPAQAAPPPPPQAPRFHGFRILEQQQVVSEDVKEDLAELLGDEDSFQPPTTNAFYAEMGIAFSNAPGAPSNDVLISLSCKSMQGHNFVWPHRNNGITPETDQRLSELVPKLFPSVAGAPVGDNGPVVIKL
jgi:hypothetical protein